MDVYTLASEGGRGEREKRGGAREGDYGNQGVRQLTGWLEKADSTQTHIHMHAHAPTCMSTHRVRSRITRLHGCMYLHLTTQPNLQPSRTTLPYAFIANTHTSESRKLEPSCDNRGSHPTLKTTRPDSCGQKKQPNAALCHCHSEFEPLLSFRYIHSTAVCKVQFKLLLEKQQRRQTICYALLKNSLISINFIYIIITLDNLQLLITYK